MPQISKRNMCGKMLSCVCKKPPWRIPKGIGTEDFCTRAYLFLLMIVRNDVQHHGEPSSMRPMCGIVFWRVTWSSGGAEEDDTAIHRWKKARVSGAHWQRVRSSGGKCTDSVKDSTSDKKVQRGKGNAVTLSAMSVCGRKPLCSSR